ncbi:c-type cytochrome biogenesis protein CcsB [Planomonospora venezuelensis]|uniref:Cytochrome c-type biogenesis protein CcsB n=1 Tax=Planomonospora venezuelensis TaxID=1999 RepID=A0A841CY15_PLAVE|nr:c-type cytochrome biogenesis protein CcsB [Planomonospora venezuelensis]MBB5961204.1 cytochrome c-type biogenesis protein CcsB [Planomonospora venezuelensis]GIM99876.1 c-type cytochrome biogenesis protein CcsB [Planomonospora venezuelensis]
MPAEVDPGLAALSDQLILVTVVLYAIAMIGYALDLAFGRTRSGSPAKAAAEPALAAVGAGTAASAEAGAAAAPGGSGSGTPAEAAGDGGAEKAPPSWVMRAGTAATVLAWLGFAVNLGSVLTRGLATGRWPWGNMYEFVVAMCLAAMGAFLLMQLRYPVRFLGAFVSAAAGLGIGYAVHSLHVAAGPAMVALNSYWIAIHVSAAIIASGLFIVAGACGVIYLIRHDAADHLPTRQELERVAHRAIVIGFPIWTFAVIAGALWADKAWGRYWGWDPKEIWAFITWIVYAGYLHARATAGWKGRAATAVQLVAFASLLFNLIGVNIFFEGLHSYAELPD